MLTAYQSAPAEERRLLDVRPEGGEGQFGARLRRRLIATHSPVRMCGCQNSALHAALYDGMQSGYHAALTF
jgi:hypothetical protein